MSGRITHGNLAKGQALVLANRQHIPCQKHLHNPVWVLRFHQISLWLLAACSPQSLRLASNVASEALKSAAVEIDGINEEAQLLAHLLQHRRLMEHGRLVSHCEGFQTEMSLPTHLRSFSNRKAMASCHLRPHQKLSVRHSRESHSFRKA